MVLSDARRMREADRAAIAGGIASTVLMETAARALAGTAFSFTRPGGSAVVFCGSGNNGGDGVAAARLLLEKGVSVRALLTGRRESMTPDTREMERRLVSAGGRLEDFDPGEPGLSDTLRAADVIIDAIFGIGLNREVAGRARSAIELMNASGRPVVAADIPSGVDADTGAVLGLAVKAAATVTFSMAKPGHFVEPGCVFCGRVTVEDIGIPPELLENAGTGAHVLCDGEVLLPSRPALSHKGDYGKLLILGGSVGYTGAPSLCARAAVRSGAGLVHLGVPESIYNITAVKNDEAMPFPLPEEDGKLSAAAADAARERLGGADVLAVGPGMGRSTGTAELTRRLIDGCAVPMVIDADGLNALAQDMSVLDGARAPVVLTPHEMEFRRMGGTLTGDRLGDARGFAEKHGCILVLKGHRSIAAFPDGETYITPHGNPGMAKGGSGDVLTGVIASMLGQLPVKQAVTTALYLHSLAGDLCRDEKGEYGMTASDIVEMLPRAAKIITKQE